MRKNVRSKQKCPHVTDDIPKNIFANGNCIKISVKFYPNGPVHDYPELIQVIISHPTGDQPLSEPAMAFCIDAYVRLLCSMN